MIFIGSFFKKFINKKKEQRTLIREVIFQLSLEKSQEQLYLDSLDLLDDEHLDLFYKKLTALIEILEEKEIVSSQKNQEKKIKNIRELEAQEKKEANMDILLDNI